MLIIFESILPIFLLVIFGALLKRARFIDQNFWPGLEQFGFYIVFPLYLFLAIAKADMSGIAAGTLSILYSSILAALGLLLIFARPLLAKAGIGDPQFTTVFQTATRWNGFVALAISERLYGHTGIALIALLMGIIVIPNNLANIVVLVWFGGGSRQFGFLVRKVVSNPLVVGTAAGLIVQSTGMTIYGPLETAMSLIGRSALGLGLIMVGAGLRIGDAMKPSGETLLGVFLKVIAFPLVVIAATTLAGFDTQTVQIVTLAACVPTAMNGYLLARQLGGDAPLYSAIATLQTAVSFFTIPAMLVLAAAVSAH